MTPCGCLDSIGKNIKDNFYSIGGKNIKDNFCSLSSIEKIIENNHGHFSNLSEFWDLNRNDPCINFCFIPVAYIIGSIGYAFSAARKAILLAVNILNAFNPCSSHPLKKRGIILLDTFCALGIAIIGCVCPPLAYKLDAAARDAMNYINDFIPLKIYGF